MKLRFLSNTYLASDNSIETITISETARFLGKSYTMRRPAKKLQLKSQIGLRKYRGVIY